MDLFFVNGIPIRLTKHVQILEAKEQYDYCLDSCLTKLEQAEGNVLIKADPVCFEHLLIAIQNERPSKLQGITVWVKDEQPIQKIIQQRFKLVQAAGGLVNKGGKLLMIYRLGKWDFPKGKLEQDEQSAVAAVREVGEECNIKVKLLAKIYSTWHTYTQGGTAILKETTWYAMMCLEDTHMKPQVEEGIEQVVWMSEKEVREALQSSYPSSQYIFQAYQKYTANLVSC